MGLTQFEIQFDNQSKSYFPGQAITGKVLVVLDKEKKIQGLKIKFEGKASVHWTEEEKETTGSGDNREERSVTRSFDDTDNFFDYKYYAAGDDRNDVTLPPGRNEYPFQFSLPPGLPSSYKGAYGSVTYEVQAVMKRSWKFDHDIKEQFTVNALVDLNSDPVATQPVELSKSKTLCCLCCASGPISLLVKIPRKGFVAGEFIGLTAELNNMSNRNISAVSLSLVQNAKFYAKGKTKEAVKTLCEVKRPGIEPGDSDIWQGSLLQIPSVPPSKLGNCRIIDVQYSLNIEVVISGPATNLKGSIPIVIGTIPLKESFSELMPSNATAYADDPLAPSAPPSNYPDLPPPTYEQSFDFGLVKPQPNLVDNITNNVIDQVLPQKPEYVPNYVTYGWNFPQKE